MTPRRIFIANFYLNSKRFVSQNWQKLAITASILLLPVAHRHIYAKYRHSFFKSQQIMTNKNLLDNLTKHSEINLRVRLVSMTKQTMRVEHSPLLDFRKHTAEPLSRDVIPSEQEQPLPYGILELRLAGIETPLSDRAMKELKKKKIGLFSGNPWNATISNKIAQMSDTSSSIPVFLDKGGTDIH